MKGRGSSIACFDVIELRPIRFGRPARAQQRAALMDRRIAQGKLLERFVSFV
jgi:hypothetical protein